MMRTINNVRFGYEKPTHPLYYYTVNETIICLEQLRYWIRTFLKFLSLLILFYSLFIQPQNSFSQAVSPCSCSHYTTVGSSHGTTDYRDVGPFSSGTCYFIQGTLRIEDPEAEWINVRIKMAESSQIDVVTGLQLIGTYISGCGDMWLGIKTEGSANLSVYRSTIEDAAFGISLGNFTSFHCEKSNFINDYVGITVGSPVEADIFDQQILQRGQLFGCKFYTSGNLPDPCPGFFYYPSWPTTPVEIPYDQGYAAVYLSGTNGLNFGFKEADGSDRNEIYQMRNGIVMRYSTMDIAGTDIHDLEGDQPRSFPFPPRDFNQFGINGFLAFSDIEACTMNDLMVGTWMNQSANTIKNNQMDILNSGIVVSRTKGIYSLRPQRLSILDNEIDNGYNGIFVSFANTSFDIKDNTLNRQVNPILNSGIDVRSTQLVNRRGGNVEGNTLNITDGNYNFGIYLNSARQLDINDNNVYLLVNEEAGVATRGITALGLAHSIIHRNAVDPDVDYQSGLANYGIDIYNSNMNNLVCNDIDHSYINLFIVGPNMETQLIGNNIINGGQGLELYREVDIGTQVHNANLWLGTPDDCGARIFVDGENPTIIANHNLFLINDNEDANFRPVPICPEEIENDEWFVYQPDNIHSEPNEPCNLSPDPYPIIDTLVHRIRHSYDFEEYNDQMEWMKKADIFEYMLIDPTLHANTVLDSFYDAEENNALGVLINAQYQLNSRFGVVLADKNDIQDTLQGFTHDLVYIDSILALSPNDSATWMALRELKVDSLTESFTRWQEMLADKEEESLDTYEDIGNNLKLLSTGNDLEAYLKEALLFQTQYLLGDGFTSMDSVDIYELAKLCPWEGGRAIPIAHELYTIIADSTLIPVVVCPPPPPRGFDERSSKEETGNVTKVSVFPNPTNGIVHISSMNLIEEIWITDSNQKPLKGLYPSSESVDINLEDQPNGLYFITIKYHNHIDHISIILMK